MPTWFTRVIVPVAAAALVLAGVIALGRLAHERLVAHERYTLAFTAIDCPTPPALTRLEFLSEVQYLAGLPDQLRLLDRATPLHLMAAFGRHPWVEQIQRVEVGRERVRVLLTFREPVLAVTCNSGEAELTVRAVDRAAVLLPVAASCAELPLLAGEAPAPTGAVGTPWGDPSVEAAARVAALLKPHQDKLQLQKLEVEADGDVWLTLARGRVRWGRPPDKSAADRATAERLTRLLDR